MPNKNYRNLHGSFPSEGHPTGHRGTAPVISEKTVDWPGLPGKAGPDRSNGVKKCKCYPVSKGI
jgi:hypothetical protein